MPNHKILADIDLFEYFINGKQWLYETVKKLKKETYKDDERLIFTLQVSDIFNYTSEKGEIESYLDQLLYDFDIPQYFVIKKFMGLRIPKQHCDTTCVYPWMHLYISPSSGNIKPCCHANEIDNENIFQYQTLNDAVNSKNLKQIRLDMQSGFRPLACNPCFDLEDKGLISPRLEANHEWLDVDYSANKDGSIVPKYRYFDIRLNNLCNFRCRTCSSEFSSSIEREDAEIWHKENNNIKTKNKSIYNKFYDSIIESIGNIEKFYFAGGEPLLMEEHYRILDALLYGKKTDIDLEYNTNLSNLQYKKKSAIDYWKHFNKVRLGLSLDAMESRAEYLRHGTIWQDILDNINKVKTLSPHVHLRITSTYSIYNCYHLMDFQLKFLQNGFFIAKDMSFNHAIGELNSIHLLPKKMKENIESRIMKHINDLKDFLDSKQLQEKWKNAIDYLNSDDLSFMLPEFYSKTVILDKHRNQKFFDVFPELIEIKKYLD